MMKDLIEKLNVRINQLKLELADLEAARFILQKYDSPASSDQGKTKAGPMEAEDIAKLALGKEDKSKTPGKRGPKESTITYNGETLTITEWSNRLGFPGNTLYLRIKRGWSIERAMTEPLHSSPSDRKVGHVPMDEPRKDPEKVAPEIETEKVEPEIEPEIEPEKEDEKEDEKEVGQAAPQKKRSLVPVRVATKNKSSMSWSKQLDILRTEAARQCRENETPAGPCLFATASAGTPEHDHVARLNRIGDGITEPDKSGHRHHIETFKMLEAEDHSHDLLSS